MIYDPALYEREREKKRGGGGLTIKKNSENWEGGPPFVTCSKWRVWQVNRIEIFFFLPPQRQFGVVVTGLYGPLWTFREREREEKNKFGVRWKSPGGVYARSTPTFLWREVRKKKEENGQRRVGRSAGDGQEISFPVTNLQPVIIFQLTKSVYRQFIAKENHFLKNFFGEKFNWKCWLNLFLKIILKKYLNIQIGVPPWT